MRRVVITGLGLVTPVGCGVEPAWKALLAGKNGARRVEEFEVSDITCQIANFIPRGKGEGEFSPDDWMEPKEQRKVDDFIIYAVAAADQAIADSGLKFETTEAQEEAGVLIGSGIGGLSGIADTSILLKEKGPRRVSPFFIPGRLINLASGYVSIKHKLKGPNHAVVTAGSQAGRDGVRRAAGGDVRHRRGDDVRSVGNDGLQAPEGQGGGGMDVLAILDQTVAEGIANPADGAGLGLRHGVIAGQVIAAHSGEITDAEEEIA